MAKAEQLNLRNLQSALLLAALPRVACVLKPYPKDVDQQELREAIEALRKKGLVHGNPRQPNLTVAGKEAARALTQKQ